MLLKPRQLAAFLSICLIWSGISLTQSAAIPGTAQLRLSASGYLLAAFVLGFAAVFFRCNFPSRKELSVNATLGITLIAAPHLLSLWASPQVSSGLAFILFAATPLVTSFLCDAPWSARNAGVAGIAGVTLLAADTASTSIAQWAGALALLVALFATSGSLVIAKRHVAQTPPVAMASIQLAIAGIVLLAASFFPSQKTVGPPSYNVSWLFLCGSAAGAAIAYPLYFWLLRSLRADQAASTVWGQFIFSVVGTMLLYRIHPQWRMVTGLLIVVAALVALLRSGDGIKLLTVRVTPLSR